MGRFVFTLPTGPAKPPPPEKRYVFGVPPGWTVAAAELGDEARSPDRTWRLVAVPHRDHASTAPRSLAIAVQKLQEEDDALRARGKLTTHEATWGWSGKTLVLEQTAVVAAAAPITVVRRVTVSPEGTTVASAGCAGAFVDVEALREQLACVRDLDVDAARPLTGGPAEDVPVLGARAIEAERRGDREAVAELAGTLVALRPEKANFRVVLAGALIGLGRVPEAIAQLDRAIAGGGSIADRARALRRTVDGSTP